jgi:hypothetical protein
LVFAKDAEAEPKKRRAARAVVVLLGIFVLLAWSAFALGD